MVSSLLSVLTNPKTVHTLKTVQHNIHGFSYTYTIQGESTCRMDIH